MAIMRLTQCYLGATPGLVNTEAWPPYSFIGMGAGSTHAEQEVRRLRIQALIHEGLLVPHDSEQDAAEWRAHFGVLAELYG